MGVFAVFGDFFTLLFPRDPESARRRRELRALHGYLKSLRPALFTPSGSRLLPGFAQEVYALVLALKPLGDLLGRSIASTDQRTSQRFRDFLVERRLGPGTEDLLESCSFESLSSRAVEGGAAVLDAAAEDFRRFLVLLEGAAGALDAEFVALDRLVDLCRYDFSRLLGPFDPSFDPENASYRPKFVPAAAARVLGELQDFHAVIEGLLLGEGVVEDLVALAGRIGGEGGAALERRVPKAVSGVNKALSTFSPRTMAALLRAAAEDPRAPLPTASTLSSEVTAYRERRTKRFSADRERVQRELRAAAILPELEVLFPAAEGLAAGTLVEVAGFDAAIDSRLKAEASCSFAWKLPLAILKTFEGRYLAGEFLEAARRLSVEGFFSNGATKSRFLDALGRLEKCGARIAAFEESATGGGRLGAATLGRLLEEQGKGKNVSDGILRLVATQDDRAKSMTEGDVAACRTLAEVIYEVIADYRKPTPTLVTNIKTLGAAKERNVLTALAAGYAAIARLLKVMKTFMIIPPVTPR